MLLAAFIGLLAACSASPPPDCNEIAKQIPECMGKYADMNSRDILLKCEPYSKPQRIAGTWAHDFEFDEFYEAREIAAEEAWKYRDRSTELLTDAPLMTDAAGVTQATVSYVIFEGRRPLCDLGGWKNWLIVDRILSERIIEARASEWYREPRK